MPDPPRAKLALAAALIFLSTAALTACGGSDKPAYCSDRSDLEQSVKDLGSVNLRSGGLSAVRSQLTEIESQAKSLVSSAKSDFPDETKAIESSVSALSSAVKQLPSSPSPQAILALGADISAVASAFRSFSDATTSKC